MQPNKNIHTHIKHKTQKLIAKYKESINYMIGVSGWIFLLVPAHWVVPKKIHRAIKRLCVCVCYHNIIVTLLQDQVTTVSYNMLKIPLRKITSYFYEHYLGQSYDFASESYLRKSIVILT